MIRLQDNISFYLPLNPLCFDLLYSSFCYSSASKGLTHLISHVSRLTSHDVINSIKHKGPFGCFTSMIRKLKSGEYRLYSVKKDPKTGKRRNLGTFKTRAAAEKHEREVQYFKRLSK